MNYLINLLFILYYLLFNYLINFYILYILHIYIFFIYLFISGGSKGRSIGHIEILPTRETAYGPSTGALDSESPKSKK